MNRREFILASIASLQVSSCNDWWKGLRTMNLQSYRSIPGQGQTIAYSRSLADLPSIPSINDLSAVLLSGDLYGEQIVLPQQGTDNIKSLIYSYRPLFNLASSAPPNDGFSKTASPSYTDLPMVILFNQTSGQIMYIGAGTANYAPDDQVSPYSVVPAMLAVQGSVPFFATPSDNLMFYAIQNKNLVARSVGFINLLFTTFDIFPWNNTQGAFYNTVDA